MLVVVVNGFTQKNEHYFDTLLIDVSGKVEAVKEAAEKMQVNLRYFEDGNHVGVSLSEVDDLESLTVLLEVFGIKRGNNLFSDEKSTPSILNRTSEYLTHPAFNSYHSETEMMRYLKRLENKDLSLTHAMIPLGSCTMKLNAATELLPLTWPEFAEIHPFAPVTQAKGYHEMLARLGKDLSEITGFADVSDFR